MTRIQISDLQSQDTQSIYSSLERKNKLIDTAVNRALDARKISGGAMATTSGPPA